MMEIIKKFRTPLCRYFTASILPPPKEIVPKEMTGKSQRSLYHGRKVKRGYRITFSFKHTKRQKKPGVITKVYASEILKRKFSLHITHKAWRCINKAGSFDNYILNTKKEKMCSLLGNRLKEAMKEKLKNPDMRVPYIPKTVQTPLARKVRDYQRAYPSSVFASIRDRLVDHSLYDFKGWDDMTRKEKNLVNLAIEIDNENDPERKKMLESRWKQIPEKQALQDADEQRVLLGLHEKRLKFVKEAFQQYIHSPQQRNYLLEAIEDIDEEVHVFTKGKGKTFFETFPELKTQLDTVLNQESMAKFGVTKASITKIDKKAAFDPFAPLAVRPVPIEQAPKKQSAKHQRKLPKDFLHE